MSTQKHTVATDALETLGTIIDERAGRDAIHLAVEPIEAGETLVAGEHIEIREGKAFSAFVGKGLGIVDPFLPNAVMKGQRFWLVVYPRQITSLRHVWTHPAFGDAGQPSIEPLKAASEQWLRDFADRTDSGCTYDELMALAGGEDVMLNEDYGPSSNEGDYILIRGMGANGEIPPEFWTHFQIVTGLTIPKSMQAAHFSCAC